MTLGTLYNGIGSHLAGDGPYLFSDALGEVLPFKALLHGQAPEPGHEAELRQEDRLWALPDAIDFACDGMAALLAEIAGTLKTGGSVGLAARNEAVVKRARDALVLMVQPVGGQA